MGGATSTVHRKLVPAYEARVHAELRAALRQRGVDEGACGMLLSERQLRQPGTGEYQLQVRGPAPGNDLYDLFLAQYPAAGPAGAEGAEGPEGSDGHGQQTTDHTERLARRWQLASVSVKCLTMLRQSLREMHALGYAHGDVKPENAVFFEGRVKLIDFGMSAALTTEGAQAWLDVYAHNVLNAACCHPGRLTWVDHPGSPMLPPTVEDDRYRALCSFHRLVTALDPTVEGVWRDGPLFRPEDASVESILQALRQCRAATGQAGRAGPGQANLVGPGQAGRAGPGQAGEDVEAASPAKRARRDAPQPAAANQAAEQRAAAAIHASAQGWSDGLAAALGEALAAVDLDDHAVAMRLVAQVQLDRMMLECARVAHGCAPDDRKDRVFGIFVKLFAP